MPPFLPLYLSSTQTLFKHIYSILLFFIIQKQLQDTGRPINRGKKHLNVSLNPPPNAISRVILARAAIIHAKSLSPLA